MGKWNLTNSETKEVSEFKSREEAIVSLLDGYTLERAPRAKRVKKA